MTQKHTSTLSESPALDVQMIPIDQVIPYARNPRKAGAAVAKVAASIKEFGWRQPIVVDADMVVVVGHTRLAAARQLGLTEVPVHVAADLTPAQCKAYRLADNRTGEEAEWDMDLLAIELGDLSMADLRTTAFDFDEISDLLVSAVGEAEDSEAPDTSPQLSSFEYQVVVTCGDEHEQAELCEELEARGLKCRMLTL